MHQLIKNPNRISKSGKKYHKSNDCVVCKQKNVRWQTTFVCRSCNVPLCSLVLVIHISAHDMFHKSSPYVLTHMNIYIYIYIYIIILCKMGPLHLYTCMCLYLCSQIYIVMCWNVGWSFPYFQLASY